MRNLITSDLFAALRIVKEVDVKEEIKRLSAAIQNDKVSKQTQTEIGMELIFSLLANCGTERAEKAFYAFLSGVMEIDEDALKNMELTEFADKVKEMVEAIDIDHWKGFFHSLVQLIQRQN